MECFWSQQLVLQQITDDAGGNVCRQTLQSCDYSARRTDHVTWHIANEQLEQTRHCAAVMTRHSAVSSSRLRPHDCRRYSSESFRCCLHWNNRRCGFLDLLLHVQHGLSVYLECGHVRLMGPWSPTKRGNFRGYLPGHCKYWKYAAHGWYSQPYLEGGSSNVAYRTLSTVPPPAGYWPHERYYLYFTMGQEMPPKLTLHLIHGSLDPAQFTPQTAFRSVQAF